ncbi:hypothetical protein ACJRO7_001357 [Eucalyptus globulus]|uniref:phosphopyruvate hydratase n=1 Tax=Eucalyptus globulus TaxID=34317 RepID=A0ABD3M0K8_EUCGL
MAKITRIKARQVLDSHDNPLVEAGVTLDDGTFARAVVPDDSAADRIVAYAKLPLDFKDYEAFDLGCGVSQAVEYINKITGPALVEKNPTEQAAIDNFMVEQLDGTPGVNAILAVSLAVCKGGATVNKIPLYKHIANLASKSKLVLPVPAFMVIDGGSHAGNKPAMQEFMILPVGASSFKEAMTMGVEVHHHLKAVIMKKYGQAATSVHDIGGFIKENEEGLELLKTAIENAVYTDEVVIGMVVAASDFYLLDNTYDMNFKEKIPGYALETVYKSFVIDYGIVLIEDPFDPNDLEQYARMTYEIGEHVQIVGGDLLGTKLVRTCNALLLKVDQIGSITESIEAVKMSKVAGWGVMVDCSTLGIGETEDAFIADLFVGLAMGRSKRTRRWSRKNSAMTSSRSCRPLSLERRPRSIPEEAKLGHQRKPVPVV